MKRILAFAAAASSLVLVACSDSTAPTSRSCDRGVLLLGATAHGTIDSHACAASSGSADYHVDYRVALLSGERYVFTVRGDNSWHPTLELISDADPTAPVSGWFTPGDASGAGATSEILVVPARGGSATLRIRGGSIGASYTVRSSNCSGSSQEIFTSGTVSVQGTIDAADCMIHDRWLASDSARAETFVLYLGRDEIKTVALKARGASLGSFHPAIVVTGPYVMGGGTASMRQSSYASDSLTMQVRGSSQAGDYIVAVAGSTPSNTGDYTLTVGPPSP